MSDFKPYDWRESLISGFAPEEIERNGFKYQKQIPKTATPPDDPYIEEDGHRYVLQYPKRVLLRDDVDQPHVGDGLSSENGASYVASKKGSKTEKAECQLNQEMEDHTIEELDALPPSYLKLRGMIGLESVKKSMMEVIDMTAMQQARRKHNLPEADVSLHLVFTGNPGTGKTIVARRVADIYRELGVLKEGHLVEVNRKDLVGEYVGHTAKATEKAVKEALGGVLFIDEAYSLYREGGSSVDFGQEAIDTLVPLMENHRNEFAVIAAGYGEEMETFLNGNPGLKSRFPITIQFDDYDPEELFRIFKSFCDEMKILLGFSVPEKLKDLIKTIYDNRGEEFGNGRTMRNLFDECLKRQARRLRRSNDWSELSLGILTEADIPKEVKS